MRLALLAFLFCASTFAAVDVTLTITETGSQARTNWPVTSGVPLPEADNVLDTANLMVTQSDGSTKIASQMKALACWGNVAPASATTCPSGNPIKVVLLDFQVPSISSGGTYTVHLKDRSGADPSPPTLTVTDGAGTITVATGVATFKINETAFDFLNEVTVTGAGTIVASGSGQKLYVTEGGTEYSTLNADAPTITILKTGPLRAEILVEGQLESSGGAAQALQYKAWMYFYAGSARVTTNLRIIFDKDMWSFNPSDLAVKLPLALGTNFTFQTQGATSAMTTTDYAYLLQQDHGVTGTGWYHRKNAGDVASGGQSDGACGVYDATFGVVAWKRWAWQEYPWECEVATGKTLRLGMWPAHSDYATVVAAKKTEAQGSTAIEHIFPYRENETMDLRGVNESGTAWPDSEHNAIGVGKMWQIELEFHGATALDSEDRADAYAAPLMALNSTHFTGTKIFGPIGPCISGLGAGNLLQDAEDTLAASLSYYRTVTQNRRNFGLVVYGDSQYDYGSKTSRWWLMQRVDWNIAHALQYVRCGDRTVFDEGEAINRHIGELEIVHIDVSPFTDADGHYVNKAKGGAVATHDVGNSHWNNCTWGKQSPCLPGGNVEPFVDDAGLGFRFYYFLTGHEFYADNNKRRADALVSAGPPTPTGPRSISNMSTLLFQYEITGTASYLTSANVIADEIKLNSSSSGFEVDGAGYLSAGETQLGWSIFHANWAARAMWLYYHILEDADMLAIIRKTGKAMAATTHDSESHGAEQWFAGALWYLGTWYQSGSGGADAVKILRRLLWEYIAVKKDWTVNGGLQYFQNYVPAIYGFPVAIHALNDYGAYTGVAKESTPIQMVRIPSGADVSAYVNESVDSSITLTYLISTGVADSSAFTSWNELGTLTVKAYNPSGTEIYSDTLTSGDIANTFAEIIAGGAGTDGRYVTISLPSDTVTGAYRITFNSSVAYNYVGLVSVSTGKHVWYIPRSGTSGYLNRGIWYFQGPTGTGTIHANYGNQGGLLSPSGRVYSHTTVNQTLNVTNEQGIWGLMFGIPDGIHSSRRPYLRSSVSGAATATKPLYAVNPDQYFDVSGVAVDTTAMPGTPYYIINNTDTGGADPLGITSSCPITGGVQNVAYSGFTFGASGGSPSYSWSITVGAMPTGMSMNSAGVVSGTPTGSGTTNFTVRATDAAMDTDDLACSIVVAANNPPTITATPSPSVQLGAGASGSYTATGDATITYAVQSGALPTGWTLETDGTITGTATAIGNFTATVRATNGAGTADSALTYNVRPTALQGLDVTALVSSTSALITVRRAGLDANTALSLVVRADDPITEVVTSPTIAAGPASRQYVVTGLGPATIYHFDIAGGGYGGTFAIQTPAAGTSNNSVSYQVSSASVAGTTHLRVRYGGTSALGSTSSIAACSGVVCSVTLTRDSGPLWIADDRCSDGACNTVLASHPARPFMVQ